MDSPLRCVPADDLRLPLKGGQGFRHKAATKIANVLILLMGNWALDFGEIGITWTWVEIAAITWP